MAEKLIRLPQLQRFKQNADAKYQGKLTAGSNITISGNTISATGTPSYTAVSLGSYSVASGTVTQLGSVTLQPGLYIIQYTCQFASNATGYRQCSFSTTSSSISDTSHLTDSRAAVTGATTQTEVVTIINITATTTYYLLAQQNSGSSLTAYPRCYYSKL